MNSTELTYLFENSASVGTQETGELEDLLKEYPYFQAARAIYLKGLYNQNSFKYNLALKKTAAFTLDRSVLFDFISSTDFSQDKVALQIKRQEDNLRDIIVFEPQEVFGKKIISINDAIKMKITESVQVLDPDLFELPLTKPSEEIKASEELPSEEIPDMGSPLNFNASESHSFSEWLSLTKTKPIDRISEDSKKIKDSKLRKSELIDDFITKSPKLKPDKSSSTTNIAPERSLPPEGLMTETLARVYLEQKNYKKALQAYKILILKSPEKSGFFADQIRAIKKLQENNTGKE
ncbi:MAG TPA: hypothetical protein VFD29_09940 [Gillisia sp.]|nr:hypothetical protein [Gillisia sp.]